MAYGLRAAELSARATLLAAAGQPCGTPSGTWACLAAALTIGSRLAALRAALQAIVGIEQPIHATTATAAEASTIGFVLAGFEWPGCYRWPASGPHRLARRGCLHVRARTLRTRSRAYNRGGLRSVASGSLTNTRMRAVRAVEQRGPRKNRAQDRDPPARTIRHRVPLGRTQRVARNADHALNSATAPAAAARRRTSC